jgi:hypothetical protein
MPEIAVALRRMLEQPNDIPGQFELSRANGEPTLYFPCEQHKRSTAVMISQTHELDALSLDNELKYDSHDLCAQPKRGIGVRSILSLIVSEIG